MSDKNPQEKSAENKKSRELTKKELEKISGGAFPTPVNGQITDVTENIVMTGGGPDGKTP